MCEEYKFQLCCEKTNDIKWFPLYFIFSWTYNNEVILQVVPFCIGPHLGCIGIAPGITQVSLLAGFGEPHGVQNMEYGSLPSYSFFNNQAILNSNP